MTLNERVDETWKGSETRDGTGTVSTSTSRRPRSTLWYILSADLFTPVTFSFTDPPAETQEVLNIPCKTWDVGRDGKLISALPTQYTS